MIPPDHLDCGVADAVCVSEAVLDRGDDRACVASFDQNKLERGHAAPFGDRPDMHVTHVNNVRDMGREVLARRMAVKSVRRSLQMSPAT